MANNEKGLSKSISPNHSLENDVIVNISTHSVDSVLARSERQSKSDSAIPDLKLRSPLKESMGTSSLNRKRKISEEEDEVTSKKVILRNDLSAEEINTQKKVDLPLKDNILAGEVGDQDKVGPSGNKNEVGDEAETCGIGNGKAKWINTFDLNELPKDAEEDEDEDEDEEEEGKA